MNLSQPPPLPPSTQSVDEEHLRLLAIFHYILAGLGALFACFPLIHVAIGAMMILDPTFMKGGANSNPPPAVIGAFFVGIGLLFVLVGWALAVCTFLSGRAIAARRRRTFSFVIAAILCTFFPFGTALGVFTIIALSKESVQRLYAKSGSAA